MPRKKKSTSTLLEVSIRKHSLRYHTTPFTDAIRRRRELVRKQRIESEQRRRDELRDGYARLKAVLPPSTAKSSKVSLLDRGKHIFRLCRHKFDH